MSGAAPPVVLLGPTGSGKTAISLPLARLLHAEIIALDSKQIFQGMAVGTAQPTAGERGEVPHHLFGAIDPTTRFSAGDYGRLARATLASVEARGMRGLFVGGSGLYLRALLGGLAEGLPGDPETREAFRRRAATEGSAALHAELSRLDPVAASRLHANDAQRITRALEVIALTGHRMSELQSLGAGEESELRRRVRLVVLDRPRREVYSRIEARTPQLLDGGMIDEARRLLESGVDPSEPVFKAHGFPEIALHLAGTIDRAELIRRLNQVTRNYAKRQMTWFRRLEGAIVVPVEEGEEGEKIARKIVSRLEGIT